MKIKTFAELTTPDSRSLQFIPLGFSTGGAPDPENATLFQQQSIAACDLNPEVSENIRKSFERLQLLHSYGVLFYEAFTIAADSAWLVMEQAFRERFISHYDFAIPFRDNDGAKLTLPAADFNDVYKAVNRNNFAKRWKLEIQSSGELMEFRGSLTHLTSWARTEGLLSGQRNRRLESLYVKMRNSTAHPSYSLVLPSFSMQAISNLSEVVNRLWGHFTPNGSLYPSALPREVLVIAWNEDHPERMYTQLRSDQLSGFNEVGNWICLVVRATSDDELWEFDAQFERTKFPTELLWGPGNKKDALVWLETERPIGDEVTFMDRVFALRINEDKVSLARRPEIALALPVERQMGRWFLIRADFPNDAFAHARHIRDGVSCREGAARPTCPVEDIFCGEWLDMVDKLGREFKISRQVQLSNARVPPRAELPAGVEWE